MNKDCKNVMRVALRDISESVDHKSVGDFYSPSLMDCKETKKLNKKLGLHKINK